MLLSDRDIAAELLAGNIVISPEPDLAECLGTSSLDLHLGHEFRAFCTGDRAAIAAWAYDVDAEMFSFQVDPAGGLVLLKPDDFLLATTIEEVELSNQLCGRLEGRSSLARLGVIVHGTAGKFDPGFVGKVVLELKNIGPRPIQLRAGMRICALSFERLASPTTIGYADRPDAKYAYQLGPVASRLVRDRQAGR